MQSNITLHIVEPGSTPVDPVVPNTGLFTSGIGGAEAAIIATISLVAILAVIIAVLYYRNKKQGKLISLKHSKATTTGLTTLALLVSIGTVAGLLKLGASAAEGEEINNSTLALDVSSEDLTIELADEPVFAVLPVELTVAEATEAGYTLTAYTEDTDLVSTTDSSKIIPMIAADEGELVALTDNTYGLALVAPEDKDSEVYTTLSTEVDTPTLITNKDYKATEAEDTTTIYYGFYITPDIPYGTYTGSNITYQANPNHITNLAFNGNGNDGGVDMEGMTIIAGDTITLPQNTYTREGYSFTGWNTVAIPTTENPGIAYTDDADFTASTTQSEDITLYAQWEEDVIYIMQEVASWGSNLQIGDEVTAIDSRDSKSYYVSRLADGNIWMTQNLDLDLKTDGTITYNAATTNISSAWTPANATISFTGSTDGTLVSGWRESDTAPYSADPGELYIYSSGTTNGDDQYSSLETCKQAHSDCSMHNHAGNYYNWSAAVASNDTESLSTRFSNAPGSICPAGWRLPKVVGAGTTATSSEWGTLLKEEEIITGWNSTSYVTSGFNRIRIIPLWLVRSGAIGQEYLWSVGVLGGYWSSAVANRRDTYRFYFTSEGIYPFSDYYGPKSKGSSVRCMAQ